VFSRLARDRANGVLVPSSPLTNTRRDLLAELTLKNRLPGMFVNRDNVTAGGLMSYGADFNTMYRHVAL